MNKSLTRGSDTAWAPLVLLLQGPSLAAVGPISVAGTWKGQGISDCDDDITIDFFGEHFLISFAVSSNMTEDYLPIGQAHIPLWLKNKKKTS